MFKYTLHTGWSLDTWGVFSLNLWLVHFLKFILIEILNFDEVIFISYYLMVSAFVLSLRILCITQGVDNLCFLPKHYFNFYIWVYDTAHINFYYGTRFHLFPIHLSISTPPWKDLFPPIKLLWVKKQVTVYLWLYF